MKKLTLLAALVCGISFSSMAADSESKTDKTVASAKSDILLVKAVPPPLTDVLFEVCGHEEFVCCLTAAGAGEYMEYLINRYC
ncbi:hypothetical protein [Hymenobacter sp. ISL-91]|uniref:hypothetical protein n=1 Tax=Hymenobacter sp. ISL-91 TaxID=2819151 RepID=UPI001BE5B85E|nr:hypothetical protein [Hymenobacter sp. ISL-91]